MRMRCRAGSKFVGGRSSFGRGRRPAAMGVVARAGVLPQLATAAHPCAARPPWRQDGVLSARRARGFALPCTARTRRATGGVALITLCFLRGHMHLKPRSADPHPTPGVAPNPDRSRDLEDREGRRTPGPWTKWHRDVPRPFVKTGCRPEGWAMAPGCGGPSRSWRFSSQPRPSRKSESEASTSPGGQRPALEGRLFYAQTLARTPATLPLKRLRAPEPAVINGAVNTQRARFYFWYYFPKPLAEEGVRAF